MNFALWIVYWRNHWKWGGQLDAAR
jgi:hypothetical protein